MIDESDLDHDALDFSNVDAVLDAFEELNAPSELFTVEGQVESAVADSSLVYGDMKACPEWHGIPPSQDELLTKLASVNAALDPILSANAVQNEAAISKFQMSIGATSVFPADNINDLWCEEPMYFEFDLNNLKSLLGDLDNPLDLASFGAVGGNSRGGSPEHLSKYGVLIIKLLKRPL